jgi:hypothetical protein
MRSQIILMLNDGHSYDSMKANLKVGLEAIAKWGKRYLGLSLDDLKDAPRFENWQFIPKLAGRNDTLTLIVILAVHGGEIIVDNHRKKQCTKLFEIFKEDKPEILKEIPLCNC